MSLSVRVLRDMPFLIDPGKNRINKHGTSEKLAINKI